ncbi:hypothetical protein L228DRAFT_233494 [Xylona heveae TC161]|uniref:RNA ligase/cyclic nucleotide phosphodiesterase n=1 Tax=Xylona heveae (strain CBS 132557 / TC161) TaxID=1328760 RepID=A0A165A7G0_XYLHT|nr:hypothetical protein L228DRAFT_233494 [Xylona heveae TC161]KZF20060.1 hypothetical protein L228DRAFT_233494 [Xylona heveae TC161]
MTIGHPDSSDALNKFEDLTGIVSSGAFSNPYDGLISASNDDPAQLQALYSRHRDTRNEQQRKYILSDDFKGPNIDGILYKLVNKSEYPGFIDPRYCLVFWARPPQHIKDLISAIQKKLLDAAPSLWLMPIDSLHLTALEITHSRTSHEIQHLLATLESSIPAITDYTLTHRARLIKPRLSYDAAAVALSFVPAAGEARTATDDKYTYHHLRRDLYALNAAAGVAIDSRYTVPSAHLTVARFVSHADLCGSGEDREKGEKALLPPAPDKKKVAAWITQIDEINRWLEEEYWPLPLPQPQSTIKRGGEWVVGDEKGLDCRWGTLWYGGGETVRLGTGF